MRAAGFPGRAQAAVRSLSPSDFDRIVARGLDDPQPLLPRLDDQAPRGLHEEQARSYSNSRASASASCHRGSCATGFFGASCSTLMTNDAPSAV